MRSTFSWVRDNIPLRSKTVAGQPNATAVWPDRDALSDAEFATAVSIALQTQARLAGANEALIQRCGLGIAEFAELVPRIASAMSMLHDGLPELQRIEQERLASSRRFRTGPVAPPLLDAGGNHQRRRTAAEDEPLGGRFIGLPSSMDVMLKATGGQSAAGQLHSAHVRGGDGDKDKDDTRQKLLLRRDLKAVSPNSFYDLPPSGFKVQAPSAIPKLRIPLVFHIFLYKDGNSYGPPRYSNALSYVQRMVNVASFMSKPANIEFFIRVRGMCNGRNEARPAPRRIACVSPGMSEDPFDASKAELQCTLSCTRFGPQGGNQSLSRILTRCLAWERSCSPGSGTCFILQLSRMHARERARLAREN